MNNTYQLSLLTYNIDGLNPVNLSYRTHTILALILSENADIVQLQEVVPETDGLITRSLTNSGYTALQNRAIKHNLCHYFTLSFIKSNKFTECMMERVAYTGNASSQQGRDSLQLRFKYMGLSWLFINCHLESCGAAFKSPGSFIRQAQLTDGLALLDMHRDLGPAILAGDLNIRDPEANKVLQTFNGRILDVSLQLEKEKKASSTWYMPIPSKYHARYDRIYYTGNHINNLTSKTFRVIGGDDIYPDLPTGFNEEDPLPYRTASDHRGLVVVFEFTPATTTTDTTTSTSTDTTDCNGSNVTTTNNSSSKPNISNTINKSTTTTGSTTTATSSNNTYLSKHIDKPKKRKFSPPQNADVIVLDDDSPVKHQPDGSKKICIEEDEQNNSTKSNSNTSSKSSSHTTTNSSSNNDSSNTSDINSSADASSKNDKLKRRELLLLAAEKRQLIETKGSK